MRSLFAAIGFLTRIPVPPRVFTDAAAQARALSWYPLVGVLIGGILAVLAWLLAGAPPPVAAALLLVAWVWLTGGLHLDGLADTADAWVGGLGNRARTLEIMKDPRSGPAGVAAIALLLIVKFAALACLPAPAWPMLLAAPLLARSALTLAFLTTPYVRADGIGAALTGAPRAGCIAALVLASAGVAALPGWRGAVAWLAALLVFFLWRRAGRRRLGGMTGDTLGALAELTEATILVVWVGAPVAWG